MGESLSKGSKIDVDAPKLVAFIGCIVMICEGLLYFVSRGLPGSRIFTMYVILGIACIAAGVILFLILKVVDLGFELPIPYKWWLLLALGGGILAFCFITNAVVTAPIPRLVGTPWYWGGMLVVLAGLLEWGLLPEKLDWTASKFVLIAGAGVTIALSIIGAMRAIIFVRSSVVWVIVGIALCAILILASFDVLFPYEWWLIFGIGIAVFMLINQTGGVLILVGALLFTLDY